MGLQESAVKGEESAWPLAAELLRQQTLPGGGEMLCVQQLLVKGLFQPDTLLLTVQVSTCALLLRRATHRSLAQMLQGLDDPMLISTTPLAKAAQAGTCCEGHHAMHPQPLGFANAGIMRMDFFLLTEQGIS